MTDSAFLLKVLQDGEPHSQSDLLRRSFMERGHGVTVHSRIADLRKQGHLIICDRIPGQTRGKGYVYRLVAESLEPPQSVPASLEEGTARAPASEHGRGGSQDPLFTYPRTPAWG